MTRLDDRDCSTGVAQALRSLEKHMATARAEKPLCEGVGIHASRINGCADGLDMHTQDARAGGDTRQHRDGLSRARREAPFHTDRERAAPARTGRVPPSAFERVPDELFDDARAQLSEAELTDLTLGAIAIDGRNRIAVAFRPGPGGNRPAVLATPPAR